MKKKDLAVLTTELKGVFFGYLAEHDADKSTGERDNGKEIELLDETA